MTSFTEGKRMISLRAIFHACCTIHESERSCRFASSSLSNAVRIRGPFFAWHALRRSAAMRGGHVDGRTHHHEGRAEAQRDHRARVRGWHLSAVLPGHPPRAPDHIPERRIFALSFGQSADRTVSALTMPTKKKADQDLDWPAPPRSE